MVKILRKTDFSLCRFSHFNVESIYLSQWLKKIFRLKMFFLSEFSAPLVFSSLVASLVLLWWRDALSVCWLPHMFVVLVKLFPDARNGEKTLTLMCSSVLWKVLIKLGHFMELNRVQTRKQSTIVVIDSSFRSIILPFFHVVFKGLKLVNATYARDYPRQSHVTEWIFKAFLC